jgi:hypothetical protein
MQTPLPLNFFVKNRDGNRARHLELKSRFRARFRLDQLNYFDRWMPLQPLIDFGFQFFGVFVRENFDLVHVPNPSPKPSFSKHQTVQGYSKNHPYQ